MVELTLFWSNNVNWEGCSSNLHLKIKKSDVKKKFRVCHSKKGKLNVHNKDKSSAEGLVSVGVHVDFDTF